MQQTGASRELWFIYDENGQPYILISKEGSFTGALTGAVSGALIGVAANRITTGSWQGSASAALNGSASK